MDSGAGSGDVVSVRFISGHRYQFKVSEYLKHDNTNVYHRVRVGPFTDYVALDKSRKKLRELGFETQVVKKRE